MTSAWVAALGVSGSLLAALLPSSAFAQAELTGTYVGYVGTRANGTMINAANHSMNYSESGAAPFSCDLYFPGTPVEEFTIEATGSLTFTATNSNTATAITTLSGPTVSGRTIVWSGQYTNGTNAVRIDQTFEMQATDRHVSATVVLTNTGTTPLSNVYYLRNGDPDFGNCLIGGTFNTFNDVVYQPPADDRALVIMRAGSTPEMALGLGAFDTRARVNASGFNNTNPSGTWNAPVDPNDASGDIGVAIVFKEPSLAVGASTTLRFTYNWALDNATVKSRFDDLGIAKLLKPFDLARVPTVTPQLQTIKKDSQGDRLRYELQWSTDPTFATFTMVNSSNGGFVNIVTPADPEPFLSQQQVGYTFPPALLTSGTTYWWRVRTNDPSGSNVYTNFSASRSFTVDTVFVDTAWLLKTTEQMQRGTSSNTAVGASQVTLANIVQATGVFAPSTDAGTWTNGLGAYADGGTAATQATFNNSHVFGTFNIAALHPGSTITGIEVRTDAWNSGTGTGFLGLELSWDGGTTWTPQQNTGTLPAIEATQTVGTPSDLWGRAGWLESELSNANFRVRVESRRTGPAGPAWNLDFLRVTIHYLNHAPSGTYVTPQIRNSFLNFANGGVNWARIVWSKNLPAGCLPPACDVSLDVLAPSGMPIPGFTGLLTSPILITGIDPVVYPGITVRANLTSASPSPELLSVSVDTVGGVPLGADVGGFQARWVSDDEVRITWGTEATSDALSFDLWRGVDPDGEFVPVDGSPIDAALDGGFQDYDVLDRPGTDTVWYYVLDVHRTVGLVTRLGPVQAERDAAPGAGRGGGGWGCRAGVDSGTTASALALLAAMAGVAAGLARLRRHG